MVLMLKSCFAVLLLSSTCYAQDGACDIPTVEIGQTATLTCHYNKEVLRLQQKIIIVHYCSSSDENPETVLFSSTFNGILEYYTHPEYVLRNTKDVIKVEIPHVAKKHAGRYACLVVQSNSFEECSFTPQEPPDFKYNSVSTTHSDITRTPESGSTDQEFIMVIIFGVIAGSMIVIILLVTAVVYSLKRSRCASKDVEKANNEQINILKQGNDIQYSQLKKQNKSNQDEGFGSTNDVDADTMQTCFGDDQNKEKDERLALCQNDLPDKESMEIYQIGKEHRHKTQTGNVDITDNADEVISDSTSLSQMEDSSDSSDSGFQA